MKKILMYAGMISAMLVATGIETIAQTDWHITGNAGTTSTNFVGTTDNQDLRFRANNSVKMTIKTNSRVGIGITAPAGKLHVQGGNGNNDTIPVINAIAKKLNLTYDARAIHGESITTAGFGIGVEGVGNFIGALGNGGNFGVVGTSLGVGVDGEATDAGNVEFLTGVQGLTDGGDVCAGVYGEATNANDNFGVYGQSLDTTVADYALVGIGDVFAWRYFVPSDRKLKNNIQSYSGALEKLQQLTASTYRFNQTTGLALPGGKHIGFMADEVEKVFPELIKNGSIPAGTTRDARGKVTHHTIKDVKVVNYMGLIPVLAEAIKEQKAIVDAKDAVIADLNARLTALEAKVSETSSAKLSSVSTTASSLEQNNPNPFNQSTQIRYSVPANYNTAQIIITSVDGKSVRTYNVTGSGKGQITLNASELSAGTYNYSLNVDGKTVDTKSLVLTK